MKTTVEEDGLQLDPKEWVVFQLNGVYEGTAGRGMVQGPGEAGRGPMCVRLREAGGVSRRLNRNMETSSWKAEQVSVMSSGEVKLTVGQVGLWEEGMGGCSYPSVFLKLVPYL